MGEELTQATPNGNWRGPLLIHFQFDTQILSRGELLAQSCGKTIGFALVRIVSPHSPRIVLRFNVSLPALAEASFPRALRIVEQADVRRPLLAIKDWSERMDGQVEHSQSSLGERRDSIRDPLAIREVVARQDGLPFGFIEWRDEFGEELGVMERPIEFDQQSAHLPVFSRCL